MPSSTEFAEQALRLAMIVMDDREDTGRYEVPTPSFGGAASTVLNALQNLGGLEIHIIACVRGSMAMPERLAKNVFFHGLMVPRWGFLRTLYVPCILKIRSLLRKIQPDIVHGQGTERYAALAASLSGFPNAVTLHGIMRDAARVGRARVGSFHWTAARLEALALKRADGVFCNSRYTQSIISPRARRTWLVPNAVREIFLTRPPAPRPPGLCRLLHVGVISENKQQLKALDFARALWERERGFQLQFIGNVDRESAYGREFLERVGHAEREGFASYIGPKSGEELVNCYDRASALVHTPIVETFGLVVAEALARNLKLFGFTVGGVPDIAEGAVGAVMLSPNDWSGLLDAVLKWMKAGRPSPSPGSELMRQRYHPAAIARRHIEIYRELITIKPGLG